MKSKHSPPVASRNSLFEEYYFSQITNEIKNAEAKNKKPVLNLSIGEPDIVPSPIYLKEFKKIVSNPEFYRYPGYTAIQDFSTALIDWYQHRFHVALQVDELLPLNGAKDGIAHIPLALFDEGDSILVPSPGYPGFRVPANMLGVKTVEYHLKEPNDFKIDYNELFKLVTPSMKYIWVNFPSNPTGQVATTIDLETLLEFADKHNLYILYDNAYSEVTFNDFTAPSILSIHNAKERCVEIGSFSKTYSFAGLRMGWIAGNTQILKSLKKTKSQLDSGVSIILQKLGAYVLTNQDLVWHNEVINTYQQRRDLLGSKLQAYGLQFSLPQGGLYIWAKIPDREISDTSFCRKMLEQHNVLFTPGSLYGSGNERFIRASIGSNLDMVDEYL